MTNVSAANRQAKPLVEPKYSFLGNDKMEEITRRQLLRNAVLGAGTVVVSTGIATTLMDCSGEGMVEGRFDHGVASGDPLHDRVIIWTRVTPKDAQTDTIQISWEVSEAPNFKGLIRSGSTLANAHHDFTVKVDVLNLRPDTQYYYRFSTVNGQSRPGRTKTLPVGGVDKVQLLAMSCSTYSAGYFHVYAQAAKEKNVDAALHLGDYIYEHGRDGYASEDAEALGRLVVPEGELLSLEDYRARYAQHRADSDLQDFHSALPIIAVWDDHEIANNAWREGAENHSPDSEGQFLERLTAALKAYSEWMPIRPKVDTDAASLYRSFQFGNLVNLMMLDTRIAGRDLPLNITDYVDDSGTFDLDRYTHEANDPSRTLLGEKQLHWLKEQMLVDTKWQVLGQQVLMGAMTLPGAIATLQLSVSGFAELAGVAQLAAKDPDALTDEQRLLLSEKGHLLQLPQLPYNLDAWDGYAAEREDILSFASSNNRNLVVLAGDTHNAWANNLPVGNASAGVEFATPSVSSPGIEAFFGLDTPEKIVETEAGVLQLIENLRYTNLADRGFLKITFTHDAVTADWTYVSSIKERTYSILDERSNSITVPSGEMFIAS